MKSLSERAKEIVYSDFKLKYPDDWEVWLTDMIEEALRTVRDEDKKDLEDYIMLCWEALGLKPTGRYLSEEIKGKLSSLESEIENKSRKVLSVAQSHGFGISGNKENPLTFLDEEIQRLHTEWTQKMMKIKELESTLQRAVEALKKIADDKEFSHFKGAGGFEHERKVWYKELAKSFLQSLPTEGGGK